MTVIHQETYKGYTIKIYPDEDAESPRTAYSPMGTMALFHSRYHLPNETSWSPRNFDSWAEFADTLRGEDHATLILPVFMLDHSGTALSTTPFVDPWDSGQVGFIFTTDAVIADEYTGDADGRAKAEAYLKGEIESYSRWMNGEFCGYVVKPPKGEKWSDDCGESVWGYETVEDAVACAKESIDAEISYQSTRVHVGIPY